MMQTFQSAFQGVVEAASVGDFSQRIVGRFGDADIDWITNNFSTMVATVDGGLTETRRVLSALAQAQLSERMVGEYRGAFANLRTDINAVADMLWTWSAVCERRRVW